MISPIVITGGAQRLGLAIANDLLKQGQEVIITYRTKKPSVEALTCSGALCLQADFATDHGIYTFIEQLKELAPCIKGIIHNASDWDQEADTSDYSGLLAKMMQVHVSAPYQINLAIKEQLDAYESVADIIHLTDYVQSTGSKKHIAYAASKAALHNLTLSFSQLYAPQIKVNSIAPALLMFNENDDSTYRTKALRKSLLGVCPGAQEAVKAVNYLLSSEYLTGHTLHLDGGRHLK